MERKDQLDHIKLRGRVFLQFNIKAVTGLHIGGSFEGIAIGGVDKTVIRDPLTNQPYIPGSSLRGKMRSLTEKYLGLKQNQRIGQGYIHSCGAEYKRDDKDKKGREEYLQCPVCQIYGVPGERDFATPTRLVVRDVPMTQQSAEELAKLRTDLPFTEIKTEVSIDRVTSAANPRQMERVPAGVVFGPAELVYNVYEGKDCDPAADVKLFRQVVTGLQLLADDYLGGLGSRGSGKVALEDIVVSARACWDYNQCIELSRYDTLDELLQGLDPLIQRLHEAILPQREGLSPK